MNPESSSSRELSRIEAWAYRVLVAAVFLVPLAFLPTNYVSLDLVKTVIIVLAVAASAVLYVFVAWKEKAAVLPPRAILWSSAAIIVSVVASALAVHPISKSFFGQGFETDTVGFILVLFGALCVSYTAIVRRPEHAVGLYAAVVASFFVLEIFHALRFIFGQGFASLGILSSVTATALGSWYSIGDYALIVFIIVITALTLLPLSRVMKIVYGLVALAAFVGVFFVNDMRAWAVAAVVFLGFALCATFSRPSPEPDRAKSDQSGKSMSIVRVWLIRIAWLPFVAFIVCAGFAWKGSVIASPAIGAIGANYSEAQLPWQQTLDVGAGAIKDSPILGAGPNRFTQAYIAHKPAEVNATDAWSVEFSSGSGFIPTLFVTEGLFGIVAWIVFLVFLGIVGARALRYVGRRTADPRERFILISSYAVSVFLWLMLIVSVQPHALIFLTFVVMGVFLGSSVSFGAASGWVIPFEAGRRARISPYALGLVVFLAAAVSVIYIKDAVALAYFGAGIRELNVSSDAPAADADFSRALALHDSDIFWQARAEAGISAAQKVISSVTPSSPASTTQAAATAVAAIINRSLGYAEKAVAYDPSYYSNYLSEARVSAQAASVGMTGAYDTAVAAYTQASRLDPGNPSIYLSLAQLQAQMNKLPDALQTLGSALQVKNNYLDAIYLLSQVEAAQGNLKDAITAAGVAIQINPQNPLLFFQLGLLEYNNAAYSDAVAALEKAVALESDYANARYFLALSYARLGRTADALTQFNQLAVSNPGNQTVQSAITALKSGKSIFAPATASAAAAAKNPQLPLKEKSQ